ncbi:hypothetical protein SA2016_3797 [Sinomonas atrocyanea]|uniref:DJ-1/PfpI domain-containing protein n=1 Tax=Sinomonas atrocyanea TaxID=37927 RepID=A0A127A6Q5_9MICC|nr:type 1 glutamine amidotransferase domain-containing protein [Sinomonas atrocyanea]AMM34454.1 hypothetical protein SA2016_3797 [Sinomonas atrocyanea]GEB65822.1 glutamine amidotransferase [Sinomonas atrocyanea]GGG61178.1 glutamine amidotransferase [Sinomonas atrocyanea]
MEAQDASIAILTADYFEESEVLFPYHRLIGKGARVVVATPSGDPVKGKGGYGPFPANLDLQDLDNEEYDAVVVPGGFAPDLVRRSPAALEFLRGMNEEGKPIAMICHGAWVAISAGILSGRTLTSVPVLRPEVEGSGARWIDEAAVVDGNLVTSRVPADLDAWMDALLAVLTGREQGK